MSPRLVHLPKDPRRGHSPRRLIIPRYARVAPLQKSSIVRNPNRLKPGSLFYVRYRDHVFFKNTPPGRLEPVVREAVGWILTVKPEYIILESDRPGEIPPSRSVGSSGLVILRSEILEARVIDSSVSIVRRGESSSIREKDESDALTSLPSSTSHI